MRYLAERLLADLRLEHRGNQEAMLAHLAEAYLIVSEGASAGFLKATPRTKLTAVKPAPDAITDDWISTGADHAAD